MERASLTLCVVTALAFTWLGLAQSSSPAQAPGSAQSPKPPSYPPINPAAARLEQVIAGLDGPGFAVAASESSGMLIAGCDRGTIQSWGKDVLLGIRPGTGSANVLRGHQGAVVALAWNGGAVFASAGLDRKIILWDAHEGKPRHIFDSARLIHCLAISPDGKWLAVGTENPVVELWDIETGKPGPKLSEHADWVTSLAFSGDGKQLASGDYAGKVCLWEMPSAKKVRSLPAPPMPPPKEPPVPSPAEALAFSPDGKTLALGQGHGLIQLINLADGKLIRDLPGHTSAVTELAWHPTGNVLASASKDRTVRLWNPANAQAVKVLEGHNAWVEGVVFLAQGARLASVSADQTVRLWDLTEPAKK